MLYRHHCLVVFLVSLINVNNPETLKGSKSLRIKRQEDDRWIWGYAEKIQVSTEHPKKDVPLESGAKDRVDNTEAPPETQEEENPCIRPPLTRPNFTTRVPGRRISEAKCDEYIWELKFREDKAKTEKKCYSYRKRHPQPGEVFISGFGGRNAVQGEFPHMAAVGWQATVGTWIFKCGGSLISHKFVMTAAHCTKASAADTTVADIKPKIVRMGDKNIIDIPVAAIFVFDANILNIIVHPQYKSPKKYFDIALFELESVVKFNENVQPACLWTYFDTGSLGNTATATGWGIIETAGRKTSSILQVMLLDMIDSKKCDSLLRPSCNRHWCGITDEQVCAGKLAGGVDACQGDSGGPIQVQVNLPPTVQGKMYYVFGITSFGFGCALANTPGVYTRVSIFTDWIEDIVWKKYE